MMYNNLSYFLTIENPSGNFFARIKNNFGIVNEYALDSSFIDASGQLNLAEWIQSLSLENGEYEIEIEARNYLDWGNGILEESSENNLEHRIFYPSLKADVFEKFKESLRTQISDSILYVSIDNFNTIVRNVYYDEVRKSIVLYLDSPLDILNINDLNVSLYGITGFTSFIVSVSTTQTTSDLIELSGRREFELNNYNPVKNATPTANKYKSYGEVQTIIDGTFTLEEISKLSNNVNVDFSSFENHVRFGSAGAKVANMKSKLDEFRIKEAQYNEASESLSSENVLALKVRLREIIDNFTSYQKYVYEEKYTALSEEEFNDWYDNELSVASDYDVKNANMLVYAVPPYFIENDTTGIMTNFILLMGEFFDNHWVAAKGIADIYNFDMGAIDIVPDQFISELLEQFGVNADISYDKDFEAYFKNAENYKTVIQQIRKRLLFNISNLSKMKGTRAVVEYLLNVFGIPKGIFDIYEFGSFRSSDNQALFSLNTYEWLLKTDGISSVDININVSELESTHAFELMVRDFSNESGELIDFDNGKTKLIYNREDSLVQFSIVDNEEVVYTSSFTTPDSEAWTYIGISRNGNNGDIYIAQQDVGFSTLANSETSEFIFSGSYDAEAVNIQLAKNTSVNITEFRVYNGNLSNKEYKAHAQNFRSTALENEENALIARIYFHKPDGVNVVSMNDDNIVATLNTMNKSDFIIDEFLVRSDINTPFVDDLTMTKINIVERNTEVPLSFKRRVSSYDQESFPAISPFTGLFISPADIENKLIINNVAGFRDLVPDENNGYTYTLTYDDSIKSLLKETHLTIDFNTVLSLLDLFNKKFFDLVKQFIPASVKFEYGIVIKNNILNKQRTQPRKEHEGYQVIDNRMVIDELPNITNVELQLAVSQTLFTVFKNNNSTYLSNVTTSTDYRRSPWIKQVIKGISMHNVDIWMQEGFGGALIEVK